MGHWEGACYFRLVGEGSLALVHGSGCCCCAAQISDGFLQLCEMRLCHESCILPGKDRLF